MKEIGYIFGVKLFAYIAHSRRSCFLRPWMTTLCRRSFHNSPFDGHAGHTGLSVTGSGFFQYDKEATDCNNTMPCKQVSVGKLRQDLSEEADVSPRAVS